MKEFFSSKMGVGRYPDKTIIDVFRRDRPYFDQILHKNIKFRREYGAAFEKWVNEDPERQNPEQLTLQRVLLAIELLGTEQVRSLFHQLIQVLNERYPHIKIAENLDFMHTLRQGQYGEEIPELQMKRIELFWSRIAVPEVWPEE